MVDCKFNVSDDCRTCFTLVCLIHIVVYRIIDGVHLKSGVGN